MNKIPGTRVGAILGTNDKKECDFLGYGVYIGDEIPPEEIGGWLNIGLPNPKIQLDNGDIVWGMECWWGTEEKIKEVISLQSKVNIVSIADAREKRSND